MIHFISEGQLIKHGMAVKEIKRQSVRDYYALESYETAHNTAGRLEKVLKQVSLYNSD